MFGKRIYTLIVAADPNARTLRFSFSYRTLIAAGVLALAGAVCIGAGVYHYGRMAMKVVDYDRILAENDSFRAENHSYRIETAELGEKLDYLETMSQKLEVLSGMDAENGVGGVGGLSEENFDQPLGASKGTLNSIESYENKVASLEDRYRRLEEHVSDWSLIQAARPAFFPVRGYFTGGWGRRRDPFNPSVMEYHTGVDISAPQGTRVIAPADGTVIFSGYRAGYGNIVVIDHKFGITTRYGHLYKSNVQVGQRISRYDTLGYVGNSGRSTGPHLHFELWVYNHPVNPLKYIPTDAFGEASPDLAAAH